MREDNYTSFGPIHVLSRVASALKAGVTNKNLVSQPDSIMLNRSVLMGLGNRSSAPSRQVTYQRKSTSSPAAGSKRAGNLLPALVMILIRFLHLEERKHWERAS